nr:unnamed protein product [Callosobruchus analis]
MACVKCSKVINKDESAVSCDSCARMVHRDCSDLSDSELRVMDLKGKRVLKYYCEECQMGIKLVPKLIAKVDQFLVLLPSGRRWRRIQGEKFPIILAVCSKRVLTGVAGKSPRILSAMNH